MQAHAHVYTCTEARNNCRYNKLARSEKLYAQLIIWLCGQVFLPYFIKICEILSKHVENIRTFKLLTMYIYSELTYCNGQQLSLWCSGYHVSLTHSRSLVQFQAETSLSFECRNLFLGHMHTITHSTCTQTAMARVLYFNISGNPLIQTYNDA